MHAPGCYGLVIAGLPSPKSKKYSTYPLDIPLKEVRGGPLDSLTFSFL